MKNILGTIAGAILVIFLFIIMPGIAGYVECHYTKKDCTIVEVTEDYVVAVDTYGSEWSWWIDGTDLEVGDVVDLKIYNGHTDYDVYDDEVVGVN
jgi:hypothetical protein